MTEIEPPAIPLAQTERLTHVRVAGVSYHQGAVHQCKAGDSVEFISELDNPYDPHAVRVEVGSRRLDVGHIPRAKTIDLKNAIRRDDYLSACVDTIGKPAGSKWLGMVIVLSYRTIEESES